MRCQKALELLPEISRAATATSAALRVANMLLSALQLDALSLLRLVAMTTLGMRATVHVPALGHVSSRTGFRTLFCRVGLRGADFQAVVRIIVFAVLQRRDISTTTGRNCDARFKQTCS